MRRGTRNRQCHRALRELAWGVRVRTRRIPRLPDATPMPRTRWP